MSIPLEPVTVASAASPIGSVSLIHDHKSELAANPQAPSPRFSLSTLKAAKSCSAENASAIIHRRPSLAATLCTPTAHGSQPTNSPRDKKNKKPPRNALPRICSTRLYVVVTAAIGIGVESCCLYSFTPIMPFYGAVKQSSTAVSVLLTAYSVGSMIAAISLGALSDKTGSRRGIMLCGLVVAGSSMSCLGFVNAPYGVLVLARFLQGVSGGGVWTLALAMVSDMYDDDGKGKAMAALNVAQNIGQIVAPVTSGVLFGIKPYYPSLFCGILILIDFVAWYFVPETAHLRAESNSKESSASVLSDPPISWKQLVWNRQLLSLLFGSFLWASIGGWDVSFPILLSGQYGLDTARIGAVMLAADVPGLAAGPIAGFSFDRFGFRPTSLVGLIGMVAAFFCMGMASTVEAPWAIVLSLCLYSVAKNLAFSIIIPCISVAVAASGVGRAYGLYNVVYGSGLSIAPIICGLLFETVGWRWEMGFLAILTVILGSCTLVGAGKIGGRSKVAVPDA
ncbi:hypothetical protein SeLEV6574_g03419 [Synchytrium endobioticum]|uniref:Major facilitator superfamily (MFS) profile domain-containing protein n=1 Tax=Synchytrium endobioticum TaxID=286115 RepID=A0A507D3U9_9FUNG|nr:hypothetical protein SeLEV6574_g03419 [Synchytrium endobioticum]